MVQPLAEARLPTWSWFWRQMTNDRGGHPPGRCPGAPQVHRKLPGVEPALVIVPARSAIGRCSRGSSPRCRRPASRRTWWWKSSAQTPSRPQPPVALGLSDQVEVAVILGDEQHAAARGRSASPRGQLGEEVAGAVVEDRVGGVQAQAVDVVLVHPVAGVLDEELRTMGLCSPSRLTGPPRVWCRSVK